MNRACLVLAALCLSNFAGAQELTAPPPPPPIVVAPVQAAPQERTDRGVARFEYQGTVPEGFHLVTRPRMSFVTAGLAAFSAGYASSVLFAGGLMGDWWALVPLAGPLITAVNLANRAASGITGLGVLSSLYTFLAIIQTAAQVTGAALLIYGVASPEQWLERGPAPVRVSLLPGGSGSVLGASLVGQF